MIDGSKEFIKDGYRIKIGRNRTHITTYENMQLNTTHPIKEGKKKEIKPSIPSAYAEFNYYNRNKQRASTLREIVYNSFDIPNVVMITLTYDTNKIDDTIATDLEQSHYVFKKFIQRVNSHYDNFKYIATFNRQSCGRWHYHVLCNFSKSINVNNIKSMWNNGIVYLTKINSTADLKQTTEYLINNMKDASNELRGKKGFLCSKNCERDIVIDSWHESDEKEFLDAFDKVRKSKNTILYEAKNKLGIKGTTINESTGEFSEYHIPDRELTPILENAGYEKWESIYTHLSSSADFSDKFNELLPATPKTKKRKNK